MPTCITNIVNKLDFKRLCSIILAIVLFATGMHLQAQDIHFSQYYASPLLTNPANTGMSDGDLRIANIYRNQWAKVGVPFETISTSLDKKLIISNQTFGIGGLILHDQSSSFNLSANEFIISVSYSKLIKNHQFTIGLQSGFVYKSYNIKGLTFGTQFNQSSQLFDETLPSLEGGLDDRLKYFDMNAGILWRAVIHNIMPSAGISLSHFNMPVQKFSTSSTGTRLPMKLNFNSEVIIPVNNKFNLTPGVLYSYTPGTNELLAGSAGDYKIFRTNIPIEKIYAVTMLRLNPMHDVDALIFGGGVEFLRFNLGITYDFNISPLHRVTNFNGAFEISLTYTGKHNAQKNASQPCYIIN